MVDVGTPTAMRVTRVTRARLLARLRNDADVPVVLLHAPAGFGKTTLAEQWAGQDPRPHLVLPITPRHDDPATLALELIDALESIEPRVGEIRSVVTAAGPGFTTLLCDTVRRIASARGGDFVLVLDDVHLLTHPGCRAPLDAVLHGVPTGSQVALVGRDEPAPWLARSRAEGRLLCLGPADLAFDPAESRQLLDGLGLAFPADVTAELVARAGGWPAALHLMALAVRANETDSLAPRPDLAASDPFLRGYLTSEVLDGLSESTREFLRRTSVLDDLSGPLCDAVLHRPATASVLSGLARHLQLVVPTDADRSRYRYHHLLADALRSELETREPWLVPELHRRASRWFEAHADLAAAIRHAQAAHDLELTGRLVWRDVPRCISSGRPDRLAAWLGELDDAHIRSDRWLSLAAAWLGLQTGDADRMTRWLLAAEDHAGGHWEERVADDQYAASLACLHVVVGDLGLQRSVALCRAAAQGLPRDSGFRAAALHNEGVALTVLRRLQEGLGCLERAERLGRALGVPIIEANALAWRGMLALLQDDWAQGAPAIARAGELVERHHLERLATSATIVTALALLQAGRARQEQARDTLSTARRLTAGVSQIAPWFAVAGPLVQARTAILLDEPALARALCTEARRHLTPDLAETLLTDLLTETEARLRALQDDRMFAQPLTTAQLRVLQFLPSRLTFDQIGEHLFLSRATVKSHAAAIYRKLGASSRDEAVARACALGLVESPPPD